MVNLFRHLNSLIAFAPAVANGIETVSTFVHPLVELTLVMVTLFELCHLARIAFFASGQSLSLLHRRCIFPCLCLSSFGGTLWVVGGFISIMWLHHLGYIVFALGHATKSAADLAVRLMA